MSIHNNETTWKEKANAEYQKVISIFMGLSSGALILPTLFLREFVAIPPTEPLLPHLSYAVYVAWVLFGVSVLMGTVYHYASAKWLKKTFGGYVYASASCIERTLDIAFWLCAAGFIFGAISLFWFLVTYIPKS